MMLPLLLASLVDLAPGLVWVDPSGVLPASVDPVPTESLRATRALAGEYYGAYSAAAERFYWGFASEIVFNCARDSGYPTNSFTYLGGFPRGDPADRTISTLRISDPTLVEDARLMLNQGYGYYSSSRLNLPDVPTFAWTTNWTGIVDLDLRAWMLCAGGWSEATADPIVNPYGGNSAVPLYERFEQHGEYTGSQDLESAASFTGTWATNRFATAESHLDAWLAELYPADPPTAASLTNNTMRLDRKQLTALDYAAAMLDLCFDFGYPEFDHCDCHYVRTRTAGAMADADHFTYSYSSGGYALTWDPAWQYQTNLVVATNYAGTGHGDAQYSTFGCAATNGTWDTVLTISLEATYEAITDYVRNVGGMSYYINQYTTAPYTNCTVIIEGLTIPADFDYAQTSHGIGASFVQVRGVKSTGAASSYGTHAPNGTITAAETNALAAAHGELRRSVQLITSAPAADPFMYAPKLQDSFEMGLITTMQAWPLCTRYIASIAPDGTWGGIDHVEWQLPYYGEFAGTNGYTRMMMLESQLACDDAAEMCARIAGHDIRDIDGYLALPDSALEATKTAALAARPVPTATVSTDSIEWNVTEGFIRCTSGHDVATYHPGDAIRLGGITATASGDAGSLSSLPEAHGFAERNIFLKIPLHFLNCRAPSL